MPIPVLISSLMMMGGCIGISREREIGISHPVSGILALSSTRDTIYLDTIGMIRIPQYNDH